MKKAILENQANIISQRAKDFINFFSLVIILYFICIKQAHAQNTSASITLSAIVNEIISLSIAPAMSNGNINVTESQNDILVATIYEKSNSSNGYLVKARSENNGKIQSLKDSGNIPYTLRYDGGGAVKLSGADQTVRDQNIGGVYTSSSKNVTISFEGVPEMKLASGTYRDVITFTIEGK